MPNASAKFNQDAIYSPPVLTDSSPGPYYKETDLLMGPLNWQITHEYAKAHPEFRLDREPARSYRLYSRPYDVQVSVGLTHDIDDDPCMLIDTIRQIHASNIEKKHQIEVVAGINVGLKEKYDKDILRSLSKFDDLVHLLAATRVSAFPGLPVHAFHMGIENRNMNTVWNRLVQVIVRNSILGRRDAAHPTIRLDPDSTGLSADAIPDMMNAIRSNQAHLIKLPTSFQVPRPSLPFGRRPALEYLSPMERLGYTVTNIYAMTKDLIDAQLEPTEHRTYHEESGSGAQLINWMRVLTCQRREDPAQISDEGENKAFLRIAKLALGKDIAPVLYLDRETAMHHTSHRRIFLQALRIPAWEIPLHEDRPDYETYVQMRSSKNEFSGVRTQTLEHIMAMVGLLFLRQEKVSGRVIHLPQEQQDQLAELVGNQLFQHDGRSLDSYSNWIGEAKRLGAAYLAP